MATHGAYMETHPPNHLWDLGISQVKGHVRSYQGTSARLRVCGRLQDDSGLKSQFASQGCIRVQRDMGQGKV